MSRQNVEVVRALYDAWAREGFPGPVEFLDPEIEYVNPEGAVEPGTRRVIRYAWFHDPQDALQAVGLS